MPTLGTFIAGRYSGTYQAPSDSARTLGICEEGWRVRWRMRNDVIDKTDAYGAMVVEAFNLGALVNIRGVFKEPMLAGVLKAVAPYSGWAGTGASSFAPGTVGAADTDNAGILVLTATASTPAAASPATLTATYAMQQEDDDVEMLFGPQHRVAPFNFRVFLNYSTSKFFSST